LVKIVPSGLPNRAGSAKINGKQLGG